MPRSMKAAHPLAGIGGYQMPQTGKIGGSKGVGTASAQPAVKRKREDELGKGVKGNALSEEEQKARAAREAARARVQQRTMQNFGLSE